MTGRAAPQRAATKGASGNQINEKRNCGSSLALKLFTLYCSAINPSRWQTIVPWSAPAPTSPSCPAYPGHIPEWTEVCVPKPGEPYRNNSIDVRVFNTKTGETVYQYQFKFGRDAKTAKQLFQRGDFHNQRYTVSQGQLEQIKKAFPTKSVTDYIGSTDKVKVSLDPVSKEELEWMQTEVQEKGIIPRMDRNSYNTW